MLHLSDRAKKSSKIQNGYHISHNNERHQKIVRKSSEIFPGPHLTLSLSTLHTNSPLHTLQATAPLITRSTFHEPFGVPVTDHGSRNDGSRFGSRTPPRSKGDGQWHLHGPGAPYASPTSGFTRIHGHSDWISVVAIRSSASDPPVATNRLSDSVVDRCLFTYLLFDAIRFMRFRHIFCNAFTLYVRDRIIFIKQNTK